MCTRHVAALIVVLETELGKRGGGGRENTDQMYLPPGNTSLSNKVLSIMYVNLREMQRGFGLHIPQCVKGSSVSGL